MYVTMYVYRIFCLSFLLVCLVCTQVTGDAYYLRDVVSSVYATATWLGGWLAGWLDITRRYCIKMAKHILNLFQPSGSPVIYFLLTPTPQPNSKGTLHWGR